MSKLADDASPRFCFETKLYIRLMSSLIDDEDSTGPPYGLAEPGDSGLW